MKTITTIAISLMLGFAAKAQTVSAATMLEKAACADKACFDAFANTGFQYSDMMSDEKRLRYSTKSENAADAKSSLRFDMMPAKNDLTYMVGNAKTADALIKDFEALGFKYVKENMMYGGKEYRAAKYPKHMLLIGGATTDDTIKVIELLYTK